MLMPLNCLIELHYLPCIAYFSCLSTAEKLTIEKFEHFEKQSYRNRCHINTSQGLERLTIPLTAKRGKAVITEVRIDYSQKWLNNHLRSIESAYRNAPYFDHYFGDYLQCISKRPEFLYDLNFELLTICLKWLGMEISIAESVSYETHVPADTTDVRNCIHPKKPGIDTNFIPARYHQVFGKDFVVNPSIIDVVMCEGPNARQIVRASKVTLNK